MTDTTASAASVPMVFADGVSKSFGSNEVLKSISLEVKRGEVMCLVGPSGSGKSTFLRLINHLEILSAGRLSVDGDLVGYREHGGKLYELKPKEAAMQRRDIGMVFQRFNLFPHMTALENVMEAPIRVKGQPKTEVRKRAARPARPRGSRRASRLLPGAPLGRPAAARRHRASSRHGPEAHALRRADQRARSRAGRRGSRRHEGARHRRA